MDVRKWDDGSIEVLHTAPGSEYSQRVDAVRWAEILVWLEDPANIDEYSAITPPSAEA